MYKGLKMHNNVRWLSRGLVLKLFVECLNERKLFLNDQHVSYQELSDDTWATKLMFFADFCVLMNDLCVLMNDLNAKLQGSGKTLSVTFAYI